MRERQKWGGVKAAERGRSLPNVIHKSRMQRQSKSCPLNIFFFFYFIFLPPLLTLHVSSFVFVFRFPPIPRIPPENIDGWIDWRGATAGEPLTWAPPLNIFSFSFVISFSPISQHISSLIFFFHRVVKDSRLFLVSSNLQEKRETRNWRSLAFDKKIETRLHLSFIYLFFFLGWGGGS